MTHPLLFDPLPYSSKAPFIAPSDTLEDAELSAEVSEPLSSAPSVDAELSELSVEASEPLSSVPSVDAELFELSVEVSEPLSSVPSVDAEPVSYTHLTALFHPALFPS